MATLGQGTLVILGPPGKKSVAYFARYGGIRLHSGCKQTRLSELMRLERVSARDLNPEIKFSQKTVRTLVVCPILGWG